MIELLKQIIKHIVDHPDEVRINAVQADRNVTLELSVHTDDIGKVIGREGRIINALRLLVKAGAGKRYNRVAIEIMNASDKSAETEPVAS